MKNQAFDLLTTENLAITTSTESLVQGYILRCRCEGKSSSTLEIYRTVLIDFVWFCRQNQFPAKPQKLNDIHIREFLMLIIFP